MRTAAIYSRFSSENQSEKSIDDQVRVCKKYAQEHGMAVDDRHLYADEAVSGSHMNRPGLQALEKAAEALEFEVVIVDDLSRLSRSNYQMLTLVLKLNYYQVKIISVSDGINTEDENSKLGIQLRGLVNELYLDDLRKKTARGLEGQKLRGFSAGEQVYGYISKPYGKVKLNRKDRIRYEGMVHEIYQPEADIVKRIYSTFTNGNSICKIAKMFNEDKIPTKRNKPGGWNISTISGILRNQRYIGIWNWRRTKSIRDPMTGRKKSIPRPEKEHIPIFREDLIIIDKDIWDKTKERLRSLEGVYPLKQGCRENYKRKSYVHAYPRHLFSGFMRCAVCNGTVVTISGKSGGYYGCWNKTRGSCTNTLIVQRKKMELTILNGLNKILTVETLELTFKRLENRITEEFNSTQNLLHQKETELDKSKQEILNCIDFIKARNYSQSVEDALHEAERQAEQLKMEIISLQHRLRNVFKTPGRDWIVERLKEFNACYSPLAIRELLEPIVMEPVFDNEGKLKPHYKAHTKVTPLSLLDESHKKAIGYPPRHDTNITLTFDI